MKPSVNKSSSIDSSESSNIELCCIVSNNQIFLSSNFDNTSYALTDTNGSILLKGSFDFEHIIASDQLRAGHFVLVLFKDDVKENFPISLK